MGFFSYAYIVDGQAIAGGVKFVVSAYESGDMAYFSWGRGDRPKDMQPIAGDTLYCSHRLELLPGYPRVDIRENKDFYEGRFLAFEESFFPRQPDAPVLFHVALPTRYVVRRGREPFTLTQSSNIALIGDRLVITTPARGGVDLRFSIAPLADDERFSDYELHKLLTRPDVTQQKLGWEVNLGVFKLKFG